MKKIRLSDIIKSLFRSEIIQEVPQPEEISDLPLVIQDYLAKNFPGRNYQFFRTTMNLPSAEMFGNTGLAPLITEPTPTTVYAVTLIPYHQYGTYIFRVVNNQPDIVAFMIDSGYFL